MLIDLVGGQSWSPGTGNLKLVSGNRYSYALDEAGYAPGATPPPPQEFTWSSTTLYNTSSFTKAAFYELRFPTKWIVKATCPS